MYYRGAAAAVVVFDVTNRESFEGAKSWVKELQRRGDPSVVIAVAGNKADIKEGRVVEASVRRCCGRCCCRCYCRCCCGCCLYICGGVRASLFALCLLLRLSAAAHAQLTLSTRSFAASMLSLHCCDASDSCPLLLVQEASDYARDQGIIYMDTSAKTGQNVTDIFVAIGESQCMQRPTSAHVDAFACTYLLQLAPTLIFLLILIHPAACYCHLQLASCHAAARRRSSM